MSDNAHHVLIRNGSKGELEIDGAEFPWTIKDEPKINKCDDIIEVTLTLYADRVTVTYEPTADAHTPS